MFVACLIIGGCINRLFVFISMGLFRFRQIYYNCLKPPFLNGSRWTRTTGGRYSRLIYSQVQLPLCHTPFYKIGLGNGDRTRNYQSHSLVFCQLNYSQHKLAERAGFKLAEHLCSTAFETAALNRTRPPLRRKC